MFKCVLCSINYNNPSFGANDIYSIMNKEFCQSQMNFEQFQSLYNEVFFKLLKYETYWPGVINKQCHPSNIIVEISKKSLKIAIEGTCSYLRYCISKDQVGRKVNVIVRDKVYNSKMGIVYLLLSDGWESVWAAIETRNILQPYLLNDSKVSVGTKLSLCLWIIHPLSNIL